MRLLHYSPIPLEELEDRTADQCRGTKPSGFWVSIEGEMDWYAYCDQEKFRDLSEFFLYEVLPEQGARVLHIKDAAAIDQLTKLFGRITRLPEDPRTEYVIEMNWPEIAKRYQGIIIAPYIWERRTSPKTRWYFNWGCASGCIWDTRSISVKRVEK